jgi:type I restriction enzyme S subunit
MFYRETEFQETEIGEIPKDWNIERLGRLINYVKGKKPKKLYDQKINENSLAYLTAEYMRGLEKPKWCNPKEDPSMIKVNSDDVIMIWDGSYAGHVFTGFNGVLASTMIKIVPKYNNLDKKFLYYYLTISSRRLRGTTVGTGVPHINKKIFEELYIPLPPLEEQKRIADILSMIDRGIESVDRAIAKLERMKKALLNELLTGRIRVREESGKLMFYRETEFQDTEIGEIPKDWKLVKLSNIVEDIYYGITAKAVEHKTGLKILRTTDIKDYNVDWDSLPFCEITEKRGNIQRFLLKKGDIIIARAGTTGVCVLVEKDFEDVIFGSYLIKIRLNKNVYPRFIYYFCQSHSYWNQITSGQAGSTIKNINIPLLKSLNVPLPSSVKEQTAITEILSTVDKAIELYRREKERLLRLKRGLMSVLLTGSVRVVSDVRDVEVNV